MKNKNPIWTEDLVKHWLEDAIRTLRRLPPVRVQGYKTAWPQMLNSEMEKLQMDHKPTRWAASSFDISRMELVIEWIQWINEVDDRHLLWLSAKKNTMENNLLETWIFKTNFMEKMENLNFCDFK